MSTPLPSPRDRAGEIEYELLTQKLWIQRWLEQTEYRATGHPPTNGYAYAPIPDWEMRQRLSRIEEALRK